MQVSLNYLSELTGIDRRRVTRLLTDLPSQPGPNNSKTVDSALAIRVLYAGADGDGRLDAPARSAPPWIRPGVSLPSWTLPGAVMS